MSEIKLPFTEKVAKIIAGVVIALLIGGYVLYFGAKSDLRSQTKEFEALKTEHSELTNVLNDIKSKYDNVAVDMKQMSDSVHDSVLKFQECQQKLNALEAKYDALRMATPGAQSAPAAAAPATAPATTPAAPASSALPPPPAPDATTTTPPPPVP